MNVTTRINTTKHRLIERLTTGKLFYISGYTRVAGTMAGSRMITCAAQYCCSRSICTNAKCLGRGPNCCCNNNDDPQYHCSAYICICFWRKSRGRVDRSLTPVGGALQNSVHVHVASISRSSQAACRYFVPNDPAQE